MIVLSILFFFSLILGGIFVWKYFYKSSFFLSQIIFLGAYSVILFFFMLIKIPLTRVVVLFPIILLPLVLYKITSAPWKNLLPAKKLNIYSFILLALTVLILFFGITHIMKLPIYDRDGLGIWLTKAKMITLDNTIFSENFLDPYRIHDHPRYPLLLPILESAYFISSDIDETGVKILFIYIWVLMLGVLYEFINKKSLNAALIAIIIFSLIPAYYTMSDGSLDTGYADIPLSLFYLGAIIFLYNYLYLGEKKFLLGTGLCLAFAIFTKNEGGAFALSTFIIFFFIKKKKADILTLALAILLPVIPWLITVLHLPELYTEHYLSYVPAFFRHLHRVPVIIKATFLEILNPKHWGIFWPLSIFIFIYSKPKKIDSYLLANIGILFILYLGIFLITPWEVEFQMKIVLPRMLLHIAPAIMFLAAQNYSSRKQLTNHLALDK